MRNILVSPGHFELQSLSSSSSLGLSTPHIHTHQHTHTHTHTPYFVPSLSCLVLSYVRYVLHDIVSSLVHSVTRLALSIRRPSPTAVSRRNPTLEPLTTETIRYESSLTPDPDFDQTSNRTRLRPSLYFGYDHAIFS